MVTSEPRLDPAAFDAFAGDYDAHFTRSHLARLLRPRVWEHLAQQFWPGEHILELACGTGEDALWLARLGIRVTATDGSAEMVRRAQEKTQPPRVLEQDRTPGVASEMVTFKQLSFQQLMAGYFEEEEKVVFDGAYSNFGGLNTINTWPLLAERLAQVIKPGGKLVLVPMGPFCPWEIAWHLGHGQLKTAFRRFGRSAPAKIGGAVIPIWYPSARRLRSAFSPWFEHCLTESLGLWLPPSYLEHLVKRWPALFGPLNGLEARTARLTRDWGDHYIVIFRRNG